MATKEVFRPVPGASIRVNPVATSSAAVSLGTLDEQTNVLRCYNKKATDVYIRLGDATVGAATTATDIPIPSGQVYDIARSMDTNFRHIGENAEAGDLIITPGTYVKV